MTNHITSKSFLNYLTSLNLVRWNIKIDATGATAILSRDSEPNIQNFTQVIKQKDGTWYVRLSTEDVHNEMITNGFFK